MQSFLDGNAAYKINPRQKMHLEILQKTSWTSLYWTAMSSFCFQTSGHHRGEYLEPKLRPGIGFFGPHFF